MNFPYNFIPKINLGSVLALLLFPTLFFVAGVKAQEGFDVQEGVQISPTRIDIDLDTVSDEGYYESIINLKNYEDKSYKVMVEIEDFYVNDDSTQAMFFVPQENHPLKAYDMINWIEVDREIIMNPRESKNIPIKIRVPKKTPTGGYYGAIFFKTERYDADVLAKDENSGESVSTKVGVKQRVGMLLTIAVKGVEPIRREADITEFNPEKKIFWQAPAKLNLNLRNKGNIHFKVTGDIKVKKFGMDVTNGKFEERILYPGKDRAYDFDWNFSNWSYGFYKATANFISEDGEIKMFAETTFWVIPWKTTLSIIILLIIIWLIFRIFTSKFEIRKKEDKEEYKKDDNEGVYNKSDEFIDEDLRFKR